MAPLSIALMNLKKIGGGGQAKQEEILDHAIKDKEFIKKEIELCDPLIIIGGIGNNALWSRFLGDMKFVSSGYGIEVAK